MALQKMKSMQGKPKGRKKNGKFEKVKFPAKKDMSSITNPDLSSLRKPIDTSVSALYQVSKLLEDGTDEVKSILSYECDIIYECRVCRSLFRSIINLISHKREYCRENFNITLCRNVLDDISLIAATESMIHMCKTGESIIKDGVKNDRILRSQVAKVSDKKDLSKIVEMLSKRQEEDMKNNSLNMSKIESTVFSASNKQDIYLEPIDTNSSAVYQTVKPSDTIVDTTDLMKGQLAELQDMMDENTVTLEGSIDEGQLEKSDSPIQADMSDEENELLIDRLSTSNLICNICNAKFSTKKTLTFHMKTLHTSQRMCYPCPCCTNTFANTWSVHRHLIKVHRKTNEQVRKLRSHIQAKAFHRETNSIEDSKKTRAAKISTMEKVTMKDDDKNEWRKMCHSESDGECQICIECGKKFDGKAALSAHLQYCQASNAVCNKIMNASAEQTDQHKSTNKTLSNSLTLSVLSNRLCEVEDANTVTNTIIQPSINKNMNSRPTSLSPETIDEHHKSSIRVETVSSLSKEDWDTLENDCNYSSECTSVDNNNLDIIAPPMSQNIDNGESVSSNENRNHSESNKKSQSPEIICTSINETNSTVSKVRSKKKRMSSQHNEKQLNNLKERDIAEVQEDSSKLQQSSRLAQPSERERTLLMEHKIATIANLRKLQCLLCKRKFMSMTNLRRHMAIHIGWDRYRCKLCDFKCFVKCDCVAHCNKMHNTQNNRATIAEMVVEIPQNEYMYNEDIIMDVTNMEDKTDDPDTVDITTSPYQREIHEDISNSSDTDSCVTLSSKTVGSEQVTDSCKDERVNIDGEDNDETTQMQDLTKYMMNLGPGRLDAHPDLKRMVMEVILGSNDAGHSEITNSDKVTLNTNDDAEVDIDANDNKSTTPSKSHPIDKTKRESCSISSNSKHQRPTRNRIKPLNEDFVYDLKKVLYRKDYTLFKEPSFQLNKSSLDLCDSETLHARKKTKICN